MVNLIRREIRPVQANRGEPGLDPHRSPDPFRVMDALLRWDPFRELSGGWSGKCASFLSHFDVKDTKNGYLFRADMPGVKESDLDISVTGNVLTISGKREEEHCSQGEQYYAAERSFGQFSRSFTLPEGCDLDSVKADLKDGVLTVNLAKKSEVQPRKIAIGNASPTKA